MATFGVVPFLLPLHVVLAAEGMNQFKCKSDGPQEITLADSRIARYSCKSGKPHGGYSIHPGKFTPGDRGKFQNGQLVGVRTVGIPTKRSPNELTYRNGRLHGSANYFQFYSDNQVLAANFRRDQHGSQITLFSSVGDRIEDRPLRKAIANGPGITDIRRLHPYVPEYKVNWRNGLYHGKRTRHDESGKQIETIEYDSGRLLSADFPVDGIRVAFPDGTLIPRSRLAATHRLDIPAMIREIPACEPAAAGSKAKSGFSFAIVAKKYAARYRCRNGKFDGPLQLQVAVQNDPDFGFVSFAGAFESGVLSGPYTIFDKGTIVESGTYKSSKLHGSVKYFYTGELSYQQTYVDGQPESALVFFHPRSLRSFRESIAYAASLKKKSQEFKDAVCDSAEVDWNEGICMDRARRAADKATGMKYLEAGCAQKKSPACLELGVFSDDPNRRQKLWRETCQRDSKVCVKYVKALFSLGRPDLVFDLMKEACDGGEKSSECLDLEKFKAFKKQKKP